MSIQDYISFVEYAALHGVTANAVRRKALRGGFKTAQKIGRNWVIDRNEPYIDNRIVSGKYIDVRQNAESPKEKNEK